MLKDYKRKTFLLIDMSVPTDNNISVKEYNKISEYKDEEIEIKEMWNLKTTTVPVIEWDQLVTKKDIWQSQPIWNAKQLHFAELLISFDQCD